MPPDVLQLFRPAETNVSDAVLHVPAMAGACAEDQRVLRDCDLHVPSRSLPAAFPRHLSRLGGSSGS